MESGIVRDPLMAILSETGQQQVVNPIIVHTTFFHFFPRTTT